MNRIGWFVALTVISVPGCGKHNVSAPEPGALSRWEAIGPTGGSVLGLAVSGSTVFAGTNGGGVYRSTDAGAHWAPVHDGLTRSWCRALWISGTTVFAGTGDEMFRSIDNGNHWAPDELSGVTSFAQIGSSVFAGYQGLDGVGGGVYRSTDLGETWTNVTNDLFASAVAALASRGTTLFAATLPPPFAARSFQDHNLGTSEGVYRSTDGGEHWTYANTGLVPGSVSGFSVSGSSIFALSDGATFRSTDDGDHWTAVGGLVGVGVASLVSDGAGLFAVTREGRVFRSTDGGDTWVEGGAVASSLVNVIAAGGGNLFVGTDAGVFRSTDNGAHWATTSTGLTNIGFGVIASSGTSLFAVTGTGLLTRVIRSTDDGVTWTEVTGLAHQEVRAFATLGTTLFAGTENGVFRSSDNGATWTAVNDGLSNVNVLTLVAAGSRLFAGTKGGVFRSDDGGAIWHAGGLREDGRPMTASDLAVIGSHVFAACYDPNYACYSVFRSINADSTWIDINPTNPFEDPNALAVRGKTLFLGGFYPSDEGSRGGVFRTRDDGATWTATELTGVSISALAVNGSELYAATGAWFFGEYVPGARIYRSSDEGASWTDVSGSLKDIHVTSFAVGNGNLYAATRGNGIWRLR